MLKSKKTVLDLFEGLYSVLRKHSTRFRSNYSELGRRAGTQLSSSSDIMRPFSAHSSFTTYNTSSQCALLEFYYYHDRLEKFLFIN